MFDTHLAKALKLREHDRIVGFLYLGTVARLAGPVPEAAVDDFVRHL